MDEKQGRIAEDIAKHRAISTEEARRRFAKASRVNVPALRRLFEDTLRFLGRAK